eukprot:TRINITY_DN2000_c0_g1_i1.p1 TRINITY_DN2000_c0_g1~~TRINITY_DN2000_c0_g1_i1.p1  ORF type:complete len:348 (+),score=105.81 TRINITY_DN2000_c0_g1_i1:25-1068(+)
MRRNKKVVSKPKPIEPSDITMSDPSYLVPFPRHVFRQLEQYFPYVDLASLDDMEKKVEKSEDGEFCCSPTFHPIYIQEVVKRGIFPMATEISGVPMPLIKLHKKRCVLDLANLRIEKSVRKKCKDCVITINRKFDSAVKMCLKQHEDCWLYPQLIAAFKEIHSNPDKYQMGIQSIELWAKDPRKQDEQQSEEKSKILVAVELGYTYGRIYTSLTGAILPGTKSMGTIQLCSMIALLEEMGFTHCDFGMAMDYKLNLGAREIPREDWLELVKREGGAAHSDRIRLDTKDMHKCGELIERYKERRQSKKEIDADEKTHVQEKIKAKREKRDEARRVWRERQEKEAKAEM